MNLTVKKGKDLSENFIKNWDKLMIKTFSFGNDELLKKRGRKEFAKETFFILRDNKKKILSLGRLRPVKLKFNNKTYNIEGIADIVSLEKRSGYGRKICEAMIKYLKSKGKTGIGFCDKKNTEFYRKVGFKTKKNLVRRFVHQYRDSDGKLINGGEGEMDCTWKEKISL